MDLIINLFATCGVVLIGLLATAFYNESLTSLMNKDKHWTFMLLINLGILAFEAVIFSWIPSATNRQITMMDGLIVFEGGKIVRNLGILLLVQAFCILLAILKMLWSALRKKSKLSGKFLLIDLAFGAVFTYVGIKLVENDSTIVFGGSTKIADFLLLLIALGGFACFIAALKTVFTGKNDKKHPQSSPGAQTMSAETTESPVERFEKIRAERNRLTGLGNYAAQIPMLREATALPLDDARKTKLWNYLGLAYANTGESAKSEDCYNTALRFSPGNSGSLNNLALLYADRKQYHSAIQYMTKALDAAKKSGQPLGMFWGNYAYICGLKGDRTLAEHYLQKAAEAGYDEKDIRAIRNKIGLN